MFFNKYGATYMISFLRPKKSRTRNLNFSKFKLSSRRKKDFGHFLSYYPPCQTLDILLLGSTRYLGLYGASYKIFSLGPKRLLKTHTFFLKEGNLFSKEMYLPHIFSESRVLQTSENVS